MVIIKVYLLRYNNGTCDTEVNLKVPFCCIVNILPGFQYMDNGENKVSYSLCCLSVIEEKCRKTISVDGCGPVEVTLNLLKVIGCIPIIANAEVRGDCGQYCNELLEWDNQIQICCSSSICIDNVLKCSVECLPPYEINCNIGWSIHLIIIIMRLLIEIAEE